MKSSIAVVTFFFFLIMPLCLLYPEEVLVEKYVEKARDFFIVNDYAKAYSYINFVLRYYDEEGLPEDIRQLSRDIYYQLIKITFEKKDSEMLDEISMWVESYPAVASGKVIDLLESAKESMKSAANDNESGMTTDKAGEKFANPEIDEFIRRQELLAMIKEKRDSEHINKLESLISGLLEEKKKDTASEDNNVQVIIIILNSILILLLLINILLVTGIYRNRRR
ncbi:MAG: hypothetical protein JW881_14915 [Spirochaetales bacterium]|nr:hypothetical protein [Spirochaetales bacterium]